MDILLLSTYQIATISILIYMSLWFVVATVIKRNDIVDIAWGFGFIVTAFVVQIANGAFTPRAMLVVFLVLLWGLRLSLHIGTRNHGVSEDFRYANWRRDWGKWVVPRAFVQIFMLQGLMMFLVSLSMLSVLTYRGEALGIVDVLGLLMWGVGFFFEAVGDYQLRVFKNDPKNKGKIMTTGLWQYTRHPNYFGEVTMWWGIFLIATHVPFAWVSLVSPVMITILILGVSGIPMLEKKYEGNAQFESYKRRTSAFFPLPPRR